MTRILFLAGALAVTAGCDGESSSQGGVADAADVIASDTVDDTATSATTDTTTTTEADTSTTGTDTASTDTGTSTGTDVVVVPDTSGSAVTLIHFSGATITVEGSGVDVSGTVATIYQPGVYVADGTSSDARLVIDSSADGTVYLTLAGVDLTSTTNAPLAIMSADDAVLVLEDGTTSRLTDP